VETAGNKLLTITVVDDGGNTAELEENAHAPLHQLLHKGLKALFGDPAPRDEDYDLVVGGQTQNDLDKSVAEAGIADGTEVAILRKDMPRG
jgi:hypothetical protein